MESEIAAIYGGKVRVRACGLCLSDGKLLLVNHQMQENSDFWALPGGGVEFGHSIRATVERELREETGLTGRCGDFLFACEYIKEPLHAVELFFLVTELSGKLRTGNDPELQIIQDVRFLDQAEIDNLPLANLHGIFTIQRKITDLMTLNGFYTL
jgi:8-oxo-dGTP diphosphatase